MACAAFLDELLDDLRDSPTAPWWAYSDVTPGGVIGLAGGSVGVGGGAVTEIMNLPQLCEAIEEELGLPSGYLQPGTESFPGSYVEGCACTDCGMEPGAPGLDAFDNIGLGNAVSPHEIYNPQQLADLAEAQPAWSRSFIQCTDIDLEPYYASGGDEFSIATGEEPFSGVYDGGERAIDGFTTQTRGGLFSGLAGTVQGLSLRDAVVAADGDHGGLANAADGASISNVRVVAPYFGALSGNEVGGVVGSLTDSSLSNVDVESPVFDDYGYSARVGGIAARMRGSTVSNVVVSDLDVEAPAARAGGLFYESRESDVSDGWVDGGLIIVNAGGGAAAIIRASTFANVEASADVRAYTAGGFAYGLQQWNEDDASTISDCLAEGDVSPRDGMNGFPGGDKGGFFGWVQGGTILRSASTGDVSFLTSIDSSYQSSMGGFVGTLYPAHEIAIEDAFALGNVNRALGSTGDDNVGGFAGTITGLGGPTENLAIARSFAAGNVEGVTTGSFVGAVDVDNATITESFALGHHTGDGGCFVGGGTINDDGNNHVADTPCNCTLEPGVSAAPISDFDQPNENLGFAWSTDVWAFEDGALPSLQ